MIPDLFGSSTEAGVRRPVFEIAFGGGGASGPGDLLSSAASALGFGGSAVDPWQRSVARITVEVGIAPEVDFATIELIADAQAPTVAFGDKGTIKLGHEDKGATLVFTGVVWSIQRSNRGSITIHMVNGGSQLANLRLVRSYEDQDAGKIVKDLAREAKVESGNISAGAQFPFVLVSQNSGTVWVHIDRLGRVSGYATSITPEGKLDFGPPDEGESQHTFTINTDVLNLQYTVMPPAFDKASVAGEGAAGSSGKEAWNWLIKQPASVIGSAGSGSTTRSVTDRALRSGEAVAGAAQALVAADARATLKGHLVVGGTPEIRPARPVTINDAAGGPVNGDYLVKRVRHVYAKPTGFRTQIDFTALGVGAASGTQLPGGL